MINQNNKKYDIAIIGAGVIGTSLAYWLSAYELSVLLIEASDDVAKGTSRGNSAIIHAGYDPHPGTVMARTNVKGNALASELVKKLNVEYKQCGSLVLAFNNQELKTIKELYERGVANGVPGQRLLSRTECLEREPNINPDICGGLYAPSAAVINPWEYTLAFAEVAVREGVDIVLDAPVEAVTSDDAGYVLSTPKGEFEANFVVNAAGVNADTVHNLVAAPTFTIKPSRGEYYLLDRADGEYLNGVVFQCPNEQGKGVLVGTTIHDHTIVGPNAEDVSERDNTATSLAGLAFVRKLAHKSVPSLNWRSNIRNFAGIRANSDASDFILEYAAPRFLDIAAIRSPGLSSAPALTLEAIDMLVAQGLTLVKKKQWDGTRTVCRFGHLSDEQKQALIAQDKRFGRIICRCEGVTEGEIALALARPIPPRSLDGVKRRTGTGMGRCQSGFCGPHIVNILAKHYGVSPLEITFDGGKSHILTGMTREQGQNE